MESPKLKIPKSFFDNFDTVVKYQNIQLIKAICDFKGWDSKRENEIINCFFEGKPPENKIKQTNIEKNSVIVPVEIEKETNQKPKPKKLIRKKKSNNSLKKEIEFEKIIYIQKVMEIEGNPYLVEDPTNNVYEQETNNFVGILYKDNNGENKINTRSQEN